MASWSCVAECIELSTLIYRELVLNCYKRWAMSMGRCSTKLYTHLHVPTRKGLGKKGEGRVEPVEIVILPNGDYL